MSDDMHDRALPVKERIQKLSSLSSLAVVKFHLVKALNNEAASIEEISGIIKHDPAIASRVMAIANSAFFGYPGRIGSLDQAVMLLGFDLVRSISLASSLFSMFASQYGHLKLIWAHSYLVGSLAGRLCRKTGGSGEDRCFLSGLIHDIGRLAIFRVAVDSGLETELPDISVRKGDDLIKSEIAMMGCSHPDAAKWFLESLCFPDEIIRPVETHHNVGAVSAAGGISRVIYIAEGLSSLICPEIDNDGEWTEDHGRLFHEMNISEADMDEIKAATDKDRASVAQFFDL
jgi:HD-like signal output (HDOD) protein